MRGEGASISVDVLEDIKNQSRGSLFRGSGLDTGKPYGANTRDGFRVAKKAFAVKDKNAEGAKKKDRGKECMMSVRVRSAEGQEKSRFYLHGVELREAIKEQSREVRLFQDAGSEVGWSSGANPRDVFRVAKKAFDVKDKNAEGVKKDVEGGSMSAVGRNEEEVAAKEKYEGTAAAAAVSKVVEGVKEKVRGATTRAEYEARVPAAERSAISQEEELMMPVGQGVIEAVRNATGRDVTGYYHSVSEEMIWHAMQRHSHDEERSDYVGQLNLTWDDFALLPDILDSGVAKVTRWSQETTIEYTKDYGDVRYRVLQRVGRRRRSSPSRMMIVTEWVQKMARRSGLAPDNARGNAPSTSGTGSVAQAGEDVNTKNAEGVKKDAEGGSFNVEEAVHGEAFKKWFGDWENDPEDASKVVDEDGRPLVVVHGTWERFNVFQREKLGSEGADGDDETPSRSFVGHWFCDAKDADRAHYKEKMEVFLNIRNPKVYDSLWDLDNDVTDNEGEPEMLRERRELGDAFRERLEEEGYDGVIVDWDDEFQGKTFIVFNSEQVKSVDNRGTFDAGNPDISMSVEDAREEGMMKDGVMVARNGVVAEPGVDFSMAVRGAQHASPYLFREFDTEHIGSGEGAQAYGWGLYFSTNWRVNADYWDNFSGEKWTVSVDGREMRTDGHANFWYVPLKEQFERDYGLSERGADEATMMLADVWAGRGTLKERIEFYRRIAADDIAWYEEELRHEQTEKRREYLEQRLAERRGMVEAAEFLGSREVVVRKRHENAVDYLVDLDVEEEELLPWNEELRGVEEWDAGFVEDIRRLAEEWDERRRGQNKAGAEYVKKWLGGEKVVGWEVYKDLELVLGGQKEASEWLAARGVKGIKYTDSPSRGREEKTYNYVIFDGRDVKVRKVNNRGEWTDDVGAGQWEDAGDVVWEQDGASMAVEEAREEGLFDEGVMVGGNGVVAEPGTDMSMAIKGLLHASPELFREFDTGHVGEGVGGHPYGWGIYMSKSWDENWMYWKRFAYDHGHAVNYMVDVEAEEGDMLGDEVKVGGLIRRKPELRRGLRELLSDKRMGDVRGWWGWMLYKELSERLGGDKEASEWLDRHGVRGVRYKSGDTARGVNYVIFNARNIRVTHVNESEEWSEYKEGNKEWVEVRSTKDEVRSGQSRGSEGASMSVVGGYRVENDTVGLQEHLNEAVVPVEINYTGDFAREMEEYAKENGMEGMNEKAYVRAIVGEAVQSLAEKYPEGMAIGDGEYRLMFPVGRRKATGVAGRRPSRVKGQIVGKLEDLIKKGIHIRTEVPDLSDAGKNKQKRFKWVRSVEVFGCPLRLNGEEMFFWFNGTTKNAEPQKVTLYEYGATETEKENAAAALAPIVGPHSRSAVSEGSIGEFLSRVKDKNVVDVKKVDGGGASMRVEVGGVEERLGTVLEGQLGGVGRSFKANEALVEQMLGEIKKGVGRVRRLAGRAESGREEALAVMGGLAQMVRAVRLYLPSGFGFAVEPYIRQVEVMSELAATGRVAFNAPISKALAREVKGLGEEEVKELGEARLADVLERVMGRVAEQLRRYAKREVVGRMEKLLAGLELKRKNGKLKGGKMGAEGYRAMDKVREAMGMDSEAVAGKLDAIQAELGRGDEASEMRRDELEGEMAIYSTFGDVEGMSLESAAAAYEMLRFWVAAERFAWDDKRADMDVARGDVVRGRGSTKGEVVGSCVVG